MSDQPTHDGDSLAQLRDGLAAAQRIYQRDLALDGGRLGAMRALVEVTRWLQAQAWHSNEKLPLSALWSALSDLERGRDPRMLDTPAGRTKPSPPAEILQLRAFAATAMDMLMEGGMPLEEAAKQVSRRAAAWRCFDNARTVKWSIRADPWKAVERWREELLAYLPTWKGLGREPNWRPDADSHRSFYTVVLATARDTLAKGVSADEAAEALFKMGDAANWEIPKEEIPE